MDMAEDRSWMYNGWNKDGNYSEEWMTKTTAFLEHAFSRTKLVRCPCSRCQNTRCLDDKKQMAKELCKNGFVPGYEVWIFHGEKATQAIEEEEDDYSTGVDRMDEMLEDVQTELPEDPPTAEVEAFFNLLKASEEPLHEHTEVTLLAFITRLMAIKSKYFFSNNCYNDLVKLIGDILPKPHKVPKDMYQSKKLLSALGMPYEKIDVCQDNCMLFWREHANETKCLKCGQSRFVEVVNEDGEKVTTEVAHKQLRYFPITPRLKRMFISKRTARHMRWHKEGVRENKGVMGHPSDGDAWKALDSFDPVFAADARNVRIGLATDGFDPFSTNSAPYSCWPVFAIPYNLPPSLCMKYEFTFLCLIIPGPDHPGPQLNVMLKPLIEELKQLWIGVEAYDYYKKQKFNLRAAYLWSVHDFKAYGIFAGWSVHGLLTCPICGSDTDCFRLAHGGKICYFDCHRRWLPRNHIFRQQRNAFKKDNIVTKGPPKRLSGTEIADVLDKLVPDPKKAGYFVGYGKEHNWTHKCGLWELPYLKALILVHNIDVMHQERNMAESIISTCMDLTGKTKDNIKARKDLAELCNRPTLELSESGGKPRASFCLKPKQRKEVMAWMKRLKFPDGYAAGLRRSVNETTGKLTGLKSHDYHIIMERLMPVMFRGYLDDAVWKMLAELSYFYRQLCAKEITVQMMEKLQKEAPVLLCKMEKNFPPGFFNPMQHLLIHLAYEAKVGGPVQYRWMYHIERALRYLKPMVRNRARVEGCIAEAFTLKEVAYFSSYYFAEEHNVNAPTMRYNMDEEPPCSDLSIFSARGRTVGSSTSYDSTQQERKAALLYMYANIDGMDKYFE